MRKMICIVRSNEKGNVPRERLPHRSSSFFSSQTIRHSHAEHVLVSQFDPSYEYSVSTQRGGVQAYCIGNKVECINERTFMQIKFSVQL